jgi:hypothetical protein
MENFFALFGCDVGFSDIKMFSVEFFLLGLAY